MKARLVAELQVRRLPVMNHQKRLVGIVSLADLATDHSPRQLVRCTESPNGVGNTIKLPEV